mgnify:CR=1 FL=1|jgi:hypothetical protein
MNEIVITNTNLSAAEMTEYFLKRFGFGGLKNVGKKCFCVVGTASFNKDHCLNDQCVAGHMVMCLPQQCKSCTLLCDWVDGYKNRPPRARVAGLPFRIELKI